MKVTEIAVRRRITTAAVWAALGAFGVMAFLRLPIDLMPDVQPPVLTIVTPYPGAAATDVELKVTDVVEDALGTLEGLDRIESTSKENLSLVILQLRFGTDLSEAADEVRQKLEAVRRQLPTEVEPSSVLQFSASQWPIVIFGVTAEDDDILGWRELVEDEVLDPLARVDGVGALQVWNAPEERLFVEVSAPRLAAHGLTLDRIAQTLGAENLSVPAGRLEAGPTELVLRVPAELESLEDVERLVVAQGPTGTVRIGDLARVRRGFPDPTEAAAVNGRRAIVGGIVKRRDANTVQVAADVTQRIESLRERLPPGLDVVLVADMSRFIRRVIAGLGQTVALAAGLVVLVVLLFLRHVRPSVVVALAIPTSVVTAVIALWVGGFSLNVVSLMSFSIAIGLVVDNAIVVLENAFRHLEAGHSPPEAAVLGTREVGPAILASTLTTVSVFGPLIFVEGLMGVLFDEAALVITVTVATSLLVALTLTPMLFGAWVRVSDVRRESRVGSGVLRALAALDRAYGRLLARALDHKGAVTVGAVVLLAATAGLIGAVGVEFIPAQNSGDVRISAELPVGVRMQESERVGRTITAWLLEQPEVSAAMFRAGVAEDASGVTFGDKEGPNVVNVTARLVPLAERDVDDPTFAARARRAVSVLPEIRNLQVVAGTSLGTILGLGKPVVIEVTAEDDALLGPAAEQVRKVVEAVPGTVDVSADLLEARPEVQYRLDRSRASAAAVPAALPARALRTAVHGATVSRYRGDGADLALVLRLRPEDRDALPELGRLQVTSLGGAQVRLSDIGRFEEAGTPIEVRRKDRRRLATVAASIEGRALGDVAADIERGLAAAGLPPGVNVEFGGEVEQLRESFGGMLFSLALGLVLVYLVMAGQFESLLDPFVIAFSIPFAVTGAFLFLLATGTVLSAPALLGLVILLGIVVNNAIVLVDYVNLLRRTEGLGVREALLAAGERRLRPVLMTTLTTIMGMVPLALSTGEGAVVWMPMGRAAMGGLLVSTLVTLVLVPVAYALTEPLRRRRFEA